ncbi:16S rRNA (adenine(1518)-N(6)/adenine(1519)-N(6))-dimethyltransferase RsmA [Algiphilus aromaticivorans]|uniref:16S rRNA (adenine(1518)-N(6)/adenine(1519)-N(6))- dimethyltransferase RsmA n=1 Tax=Algiphilus aromaticivorans TaxID=382454 RepID=UPI0005C22C06|nr:16S rRNA (adenine(1518)-N(6)/adenine(1519)-N(6))-dimethyltransferase RsmA [Algiphilus aromaticivorans]
MSTEAGSVLRADKRFGQNYLHDQGVLTRIIRAITPREDDHFIEIGPGEGALTAPLLESGARVTAIELDARLLPGLEARFGDTTRCRLIQADALKTDITALGAGDTAALRLVGNLPYNISTPLLFHVLSHSAAVRDMHFMLQREVVERMVAGPGSKRYGRLSVALAAQARCQSLFDVAPGAFRPPPKVTSAIVRLTPQAPTPPLTAPARFDSLLRHAFAQRRKTLSNALSGQCTAEQLAGCGIDPRARAETVPVAQWIHLANRLAEG